MFDEEVFNLAKQFIKLNSVVVDVCQLWTVSILFSKVYSNVLVYSFEASPFVYNILKKNIELNSKYKNI